LSSAEAGRPTARFSPRAWSITVRLTLLYTLSAFAMLLLATAFLHRFYASKLEWEDTEFLAQRVQVMRAMLRDYPGNRQALEAEVAMGSVSPFVEKPYVRVLDHEGRTLIESPDMDRNLAPAVFPPPAAATLTPHQARAWQSPEGISYLMMAAAAADGAAPPRLIQAALSVSREETLMADYRRKLALVLLAGTLLSAGLGIVVARRGMRPLAHITDAVQRVSASKLYERVGEADWPQELCSLAAAFDGMLGRLEDSFARLSRFSADLAHELRTPINNLMGEAEVALSRARTAEEYRQVIESSLEEYQRLARLIDSLLFLARAESGKASLQLAPCDTLREMEAVREFHEAVAEEQGVAVTCRGEVRLWADATLLRRALSNLLANALRYTPRGGQVTLAAELAEGGAVALRVSDTGCGIAPEHLPRVCDRFWRADSARANHPEGTGLGLAIAKSIMDLHGGSIEIDSEPSRGTTVTLLFPQPEGHITAL
jgi:two-component system heavy metal sensor histidine kinase CusS